MSEKMTIEQIAEAMQKNKWHLIEIEDTIQKTNYGVVDVRMDIRAGKVEKITFLNQKTLLAPKPELEPKYKQNTTQNTDSLTTTL